MDLAKTTHQDRTKLYSLFLSLPPERKRKTVRWMLLDETKHLDFTHSLSEKASSFLKSSEENCIAEFQNRLIRLIDYRRNGLAQRNQLLEKFYFLFEDEDFSLFKH